MTQDSSGENWEIRPKDYQISDLEQYSTEYLIAVLKYLDAECRKLVKKSGGEITK